MKSIDTALEFLKESLEKIKDFPEYIKSKRVVRKYESHLHPYESNDFRNGLVPHEVVDAKLTVIIYEDFW